MAKSSKRKLTKQKVSKGELTNEIRTKPLALTDAAVCRTFYVQGPKYPAPPRPALTTSEAYSQGIETAERYLLGMLSLWQLLKKRWSYNRRVK